MIQITQRGVVITDAESISQLKNSFAEQHCVVLPRLFEKSLLERIIKQIEAATFYANVHTDYEQQEFATDMTIRENELALHQIHLLLNNPKLFEMIQQITDCPQKIESFGGRIYRNQPGANHQLEWHDDTEMSERLIGISVNLSAESYEGGVFQLRERHSEKVMFEKACGNTGDAHIFRISPSLQHRVTKVEGYIARTAAAGWFNSHPDIETTIKSLFTANSK